MIKIGICGANGQLGQSLIYSLQNKSMNFKSWNSKDLDITNIKQIDSEIKNSNINVLVNCASWTNVDLAESNYNRVIEVNAQGPKNLALIAKKMDITFLTISSDYVFSGNQTFPISIDSPTNPISVYGRSKAMGEENVLEAYPSNSYVVRTSWLFSRFGENFAKKIIRLASESEKELNVVSDQYGQPTNAIDLSNRLIEILQNSLPAGIYHVTNSGETSWFEYAQHILDLIGYNKNKIRPILTDQYFTLARRPRYSVLENNNLQLFGMSPMRDWTSALQEEIPQILKFLNLKSN